MKNRMIGRKIRNVNCEYRKQVAKEAAKQGIPYSYFHIIIALSMNGSMTQKDLAKVLHITAPSISTAIKSMEKDGYLLRKQDDKDQRIIYASLTDKGHKIDHTIKNVFKNVEQTMIENIAEDKMEIFDEVLLEMSNNLRNDGDN